MLRKSIAVVAVLLGAALVTALATAPAKIEALPDVPVPDTDLAGWLVDAERRIAHSTPIIEGAEKRIVWHEREGDPSDYVVVYLHGFSATRQEIAPVGEMVASGLDANLFETRLSGHGLVAGALSGVTAEAWLADGLESLAVGRMLGRRIVLMGTSTGATLALALAGHELFSAVDTLVLMSPNFAPSDATAELLIMPGGPPLARLLVGETRSWTAANEQQERYWSTRYPTKALVEMMRLVDFTRRKLPLALDAQVMAIYSPGDQVVNTALIESSLARIRSPRLETLTMEGSGDPSNHVLAGNILAPENNATVADNVIGFVKSGTL